MVLFHKMRWFDNLKLYPAAALRLFQCQARWIQYTYASAKKHRRAKANTNGCKRYAKKDNKHQTYTHDTRHNKIDHFGSSIYRLFWRLSEQ